MTKRSLVQCALVCSLAILPFAGLAKADDGPETILPAGTLLRCTLDEPNFSPKTADVGDPVICHLSQLVLFDRPMFPRGAYLGGHLEAAKEPGHFVGKGFLQLEFDKIGFPEGQVPVPAKVISAKGYRVDRQGKIIGHGHPKRDVVEWMIPPLWPEKVITLPARGPQPALKGEEQLMLRVMDDITLPAQPMLGWHYFKRSGSSSYDSPFSPSNHFVPSRAPQTPQPANNNARMFATNTDPSPTAATPQSAIVSTAAKNDSTTFASAHFQETALHDTAAPADPIALPARATASKANPAKANVLVLRDGTSYVANRLHRDGDLMEYADADGAAQMIDWRQIDWTRTLQQNKASGLPLIIH